jgi:hypothetical protein
MVVVLLLLVMVLEGVRAHTKGRGQGMSLVATETGERGGSGMGGGLMPKGNHGAPLLFKECL